jgi:putative DNA primase/helicase
MNVYEAVDSNRHVLFKKASEFSIRQTDWLWPGWLAKGKFQILAGQAGIGKTQIAIDIASRITRGLPNPDGSNCEVGSVLFWSGEDGVEDTLVPRIKQSGGDLEKFNIVHGSSEGGFDPARDLEAMVLDCTAIEDLRLIVFDPVVTVVTGDNNQLNQVRRSLEPLVSLAALTNTCVLGITHLSKNSSGKSPLDRVSGSASWGAVPRLVWLASRGAEENVLVRAKSNCGPIDGGFAYSLEVRPLDGHPGLDVSAVRWGGVLHGDAMSLIGHSERSLTKLSEAMEFLKEILAEDPIPSSEVRRLAQERGISWGTLRRAKTNLRIESDKSGMRGGWDWNLSEDAQK